IGNQRSELETVMFATRFQNREKANNISRLDGGCAQDRTVDPLIKSQLLYQLSYTPTPPGNPASAAHIAAAFGDVQPCRIISRQIDTARSKKDPIAAAVRREAD